MNFVCTMLYLKIISLFIFLLINSVELSYDLCNTVKGNLCYDHVYSLKNSECTVETSIFTSRECSSILFTTTNNNDKFQNSLGEVKLKSHLYHDSNREEVGLNISFTNVHFRKAYLKLSKYNGTNNDYFCKMYTVGGHIKQPIKVEMVDGCFFREITVKRLRNYQLEFKEETKNEVVYKRMLFGLPNIEDILLEKAPQFFYIDFTHSNFLLLKIQTTNRLSNITTYKIEVFREKDNKTDFVDLRLLSPNYYDGEISFKFSTFNEEGFYYFGISVIGLTCMEDVCGKILTPKIYINRKGTPVVIGIVGASFIIPFVLFIFYMWNRRGKASDDDPTELKNKFVFIYKSNSLSHCNAVAALGKLVTEMCGMEVILDPVKVQGKWCNDNLILANHIVYIPPPLHECSESETDLDYMTFSFLKDETEKSIPERDIIVLIFPYSSKNLNSIFDNCVKFNLMEEFGGFLNLYMESRKTNVNFEKSGQFNELMKHIKAAQYETEMKRHMVMPKIIVTDHLDEVEPVESDGLL